MHGTWMRWGVVAIVMLAGWPGADGTLNAQETSALGEPTEARRLEERAAELAQEKREYKAAADLYRRAAKLRGDQDPAAVESLFLAGRFSFYAGRQRQAIDDLSRAGDLALAFGDVLTAAGAYLDAAWVAHEGGDGQRASELASQAEKLSRSPLIGDAERQALLSRIQMASGN